MTAYFYSITGIERTRKITLDPERYREVGALLTIHTSGPIFRNYRVVDADEDTSILSEVPLY